MCNPQGETIEVRNGPASHNASWKEVRFEELVSDTQLGTTERGVSGTDDSVPLIKMGNLTWGNFDLDKLERIALKHVAEADLLLKPGDLLFNTRNSADLVGKSAIWSGQLTQAAFDNNINRIRLKPIADPAFYGAFMNTGIGKKRIQSLAVGSTSVSAIYWKDLKNLRVPLPPTPEQRKIAEILRTWDEALEKLTALHAAKNDWLTGLLQQLLGRGGSFPATWPLKPLSAISSPVRRRSSGNNHPVMTISAKSGFLMQSDKFARDMAGRSVERYTLLHEGEFAYNKGNSKTAPYGCVFRLDRSTALVPFVYYCFALKTGLEPEFYEHLFAAGALNHQLSRLINSGVRNDGLLNLYSDDFYSCHVPVPPIGEQRRIARALTVAKNELSLLDREIEALTRQKRGLMQKLLTGDWPVKVEETI